MLCGLIRRIHKNMPQLMQKKLVFYFLIILAHWAHAGTLAEGKQGAVASRSALASQVGVAIMQQGGNAIDAAVAVGFALAVTYPSAGNLGGGGFMLIHTPEGVQALDFRETAPASATPDMFLDAQGQVIANSSVTTPLSSGVPGSVAGLLAAWEKYGTLPRAQIMAPAIKLAEQGFNLPADIAEQIAGHYDEFRRYPGSFKSFSHDGKPYKAGELWQQPELAGTLKLIAAKGRDGFYKGITADRLVAEVKRGHGKISHADLESYQVIWRSPIRGHYRGFDIWGMPPPSSGGVLIVQMLNMLEPLNLANPHASRSENIHAMIEAERRAYADRSEHLGDADFYPVPINQLISKTYAKKRFADFNPAKASDSEKIAAGILWSQESHETTHYSVMDKYGNAVAVTTTLNLDYGNKIVVKDAGFLLNNEMDDFAIKPGYANSFGLIGSKANAIAPRKRMLSSMSPTIVTFNGSPMLVTGSPGGSTIITTTLQVLLNVLDYHMSLDKAVAAPRVHHQWQPNKIFYEAGALNEQELLDLKNKHHTGLTLNPVPIGDANSVIKATSGFTAVSDPRNLGGAAAF